MRSERYKLPNKIDLKPASKRQIDYAKTLGIVLPQGATVSDASALIDRDLDDDVQASKELLEYAALNDLVCSPYAGNKYLHNLIFDNIEGAKKVAFFCFCIYRFYFEEQQEDGFVCENIYNHKHRQTFEAFGEKYADDFYFTVSMDEYYGKDLICFGKTSKCVGGETERVCYGGSIHTVAFKKAFKYLESLMKN